MAVAYVSTVIDTDIESVWSVLGDFHGLAGWVSRIRSNTPENGSGPGTVGSIRRLTLEPGGDTARERLVRYDAVGRNYSYEFADTIPFPVTRYLGTIRVLPVTDTNATFLEWYGEFDSQPAVVDEVVTTFCAIYREFIDDLRRHLR